jgi:hypothetical protein
MTLTHFAWCRIKGTDTVGEPQSLVFQCPNIFPGVDAARLKAQIQAIDPIMWHFVADILNKPLNCHLLGFANSIGTYFETVRSHPQNTIPSVENCLKNSFQKSKLHY